MPKYVVYFEMFLLVIFPSEVISSYKWGLWPISRYCFKESDTYLSLTSPLIVKFVTISTRILRLNMNLTSPYSGSSDYIVLLELWNNMCLKVLITDCSKLHNFAVSLFTWASKLMFLLRYIYMSRETDSSSCDLLVI